MTQGIGYYFKVPSVAKEPEAFDDETFELDAISEAQAKQLGEDRNTRKQSIQKFREWIAKHHGIKRCRTDAPFLLRFLRTNKYSFLKSTQMLENFLAYRTIHKDWFHGLDVDDPDISRLTDAGYLFSLPQKDAKGRVVFFSCSSGFNTCTSSIASVIKANHLIGEVHYETNEVQCAGCVMIFDMEKIDMAILGLLSFQDVRTLVDVFHKASTVRLQELHFVNTQKVVQKLANMVLQMMSEKIRGRVFCHSSVKSLHAMVDKTILPKEFGGTVPASEMASKYKEICRKMRPRLLTLDKMEIEVKLGCNETRKDDVSEIGHGAMGSFRKLEVD